MNHYQKAISILLLLSSTLSAQVETIIDKVIDNRNYEHIGDYEFIARDKIILDPGFLIDGQAGDTLDAYIDPNLILDVDYESPIDVYMRGILTNLEVGSILGNLSVSPSGAANYVIPIEVSPGTAGMQPNISVVYNSHSGNGLLGIGFNLTGLSAINRVPASFYHDTELDGVDFDGLDRFTLDGNRLIKTTGGVYGSDGVFYHTEIETFSEIKSIGQSGNGPLYFEVYTKNGNTIRYGASEDSRIQAQDRSDVLIWLITKITDIHGNYMEYSYYELDDGREFMIKEIRYTGTNSFTPYNKISFHYENRTTDIMQGYIDGAEVKQTKLLYAIKTWNEGNMVKQYRFNYSEDFYTHLNEVTEFNRFEEQLNSTIFEWGASTMPFGDHNSFNNDQENIFYFGDFNSDGKTDFVIIPKKDEYTSDDKWKLYLNQDGLNFEYVWQDDMLEGFIGCYEFADRQQGVLPYSATLGFQVLDYNGDGLEDIIQMQYVYLDECSPGQCEIINYWIYLSNGNSFSQSGIIAQVYPEEKSIIGDFSGNGVVYAKTIEPDDYLFDYKLQLIDFNGDGKDDILAIDQSDGPQEDACIIFDGCSSTEFYHSGFPTKWHRVFPGDFNGDGKTDLLTWSDPAGWEISLSNGKNGFVWPLLEAPMTRNIDPEASNSDNHYFVQDFNGDGKSDIMEVYNENNQTNFNIYYSKGNGDFINETEQYDQFSANKDEYHFGDFNGDGKQECFLKKLSPSYPAKIYRFHPDEKKHLVHAIANGLNVKSYISYVPLTSNYYTKGNSEVGPDVIDIQTPMQVVLEIRTDNGKGGFATVDYSYEGAKMHRFGKGFLGFEKTRIMNLTTNIQTTNEYEYDPDNFFIALKKSTVDNYIFGTQISETQIINNKKENATYDKIFFPYAQQTTQTDKLNNTSSITTNSYDDNYGNLLTQEIQYKAGQTVQAISKTEYTDYQDRITLAPNINTIPNGPYEMTVSKSYLDDGIDDYFVEKVRYQYSSAGLLRYIYKNPDKPKSVTTENIYYPTGLFSDVITSATDLESRSVSYTYDSKYRFKEQIINALGHYSEFTYDPKNGNLLTETNPNGLTTQYFYNGFGRLIKTRNPEGLETTSSIHWYDGQDIDNCLYYSINTSPDGSETRSYFDELGRTLRSQSTGFEGEAIFTDVTYNAQGLIESESLPFLEGETPIWNTISYDPCLRIDTKTTPNYFIKYQYPARQVIVQKLNGTTVIEENSKLYDALGNVVQSSDAGGALFYKYHKTWQLASVYSSGIITLIGYDDYGSQEYIDDPDAGRIDYEYNAYGELTYQIDERGNHFNLSYDKLGRLKTKSGSDEVVTTYTYDTEKLGLLTSVSSPINDISEAFTYDGFERIKTKTETIGDETYTKKYDYDGLGRITRFEYPSGFAIKYVYNDHGYLKEIKKYVGGELIWRAEDMNKYGNYTEENIGDRFMTYRTYDNYGILERIKTDRSDVSGTVQDLEYEFNLASGNLNWRKDHVHKLGGIPMHEQFGYDEDNLKLHRLTSSAVNGTPVLNMNYTENGNISYKSDAGNYTGYGENGAGPHAVTTIENGTHDYPILQEISYTSFNKVETITEDDNSAVFTYGTDNERRKAVYTLSGQVKTIYYLGNYEREEVDGTVLELHYIPGGDGLAAIYTNENGVTGMYYVFSDHLGSPYFIEKRDKTEAQYLSFDAWGRRRNPLDWRDYNVTESPIFSRGFTGHEHLYDFGLINMNGRVYDPLVARFLSPDNFVQAADFTQSFNRYSYVINNPLKYTDPSGDYYFLFMATISGIYQGAEYAENGGDFWQGFGIGAVSSLSGSFSGAGLGRFANSMPAGIALGAGSGFVTGGISGGITSKLTGGTFSKGFWQGAKYGALSGGIYGGVAGYGNALRGNRNIWTGKINPTLQEWKYYYTNFNVQLGGDSRGSSPVDLTKSKHVIGDIRDRVNYMINNNLEINNFEDIIINNDYCNRSSTYGRSYRMLVKLDGYTYKIDIAGPDLKDYRIYRFGFGYLDKISNPDVYPIDFNFNHGFSHGFYVINYSNVPLINIGARYGDAFFYLKYYFIKF